MKQIDIKPTVEVINSMAIQAQTLAVDLQHVAMRLEHTNNPEDVVNAYNLIRNFMTNVRIDLLITRPIREFMKEE